jgi:hypothetical protein
MEGDFRGPSSQDCEKSYVRTGIPSAAQSAAMSSVRAASSHLVQITGAVFNATA